MNVGCNDLEVRSPNLLFTSIRETLQKLREKFPWIIIILCEVTPRCDILDVQVKEVSSMINAYAKEHTDTIIVEHGNMRDPDFFMDAKHFKESIIPRFASNIKREFRRAYARAENQVKDGEH